MVMKEVLNGYFKAWNDAFIVRMVMKSETIFLKISLVIGHIRVSMNQTNMTLTMTLTMY